MPPPNAPPLESLRDPRRAALVFWGLTGLLALLIVFGVLIPLVTGWLDLGTRLAAAEQRALLQDRLIANADRVARDRAALEAAGTTGGDLLSGATDSLAIADLQSLLADAVQATGARLISTQGLEGRPVEGQPGVVRVGARVQAEVTHEQLRDLLYGLESGTPRLLVEAMDLRVRGRDGRSLDMTLSVAGFRLDAAPPDAAAPTGPGGQP